MERAPRRRRLGLLAFVIGLPVLALGPWAYAATSAPEVPTISFSATGTAPVVCGSRPNVTNLVIKHGTRVIIANRTGVTATVDIGRQRLLELADGTGARIRLKRGQHDLQLIPRCVVVSETEKAVVQVLTAAQMRDLLTPSPSPDGEVNDPDEPEVTVAAESTSDPASMSGNSTATNSGSVSDAPEPSQPGTTTGPAIGAVDPTGPPLPEGRPVPDDVTVIEADAIQLDEPSDPEGVTPGRSDSDDLRVRGDCSHNSGYCLRTYKLIGRLTKAPRSASI